jgi:hypothetical protein
MMHVVSIDGIPLGSDAWLEEMRRHPEARENELRKARSLVQSAKQKASESLARLNEAPEPHDTTNDAFAVLYDAHYRDREALFDALRQLEAVRQVLSGAAAPLQAGISAGSLERG